MSELYRFYMGVRKSLGGLANNLARWRVLDTR